MLKFQWLWGFLWGLDWGGEMVKLGELKVAQNLLKGLILVGLVVVGRG